MPATDSALASAWKSGIPRRTENELEIFLIHRADRKRREPATCKPRPDKIEPVNRVLKAREDVSKDRKIVGEGRGGWSRGVPGGFFQY
jgi:hypothetical protein